jgi:hypothetical protein
MADVTFDEVLELAKQLDSAKRLLLAIRLEESIPATERDIALREALRAEGAFVHAESLFGKFATSSVEWEESELNAFLHRAQTEWEEELDMLTNDDSADPKC